MFILTCFVYLQPFCVTLDFKPFIDPIHILFLLYLLLWFGDFTIKNLQDFIKIYRALIKDIFLFVLYSLHLATPKSRRVVLMLSCHMCCFAVPFFLIFQRSMRGISTFIIQCMFRHFFIIT